MEVVNERFSDGANRVVEAAEEEARRLGHGHLGTEHLLLGLLVVGDSTAGAVLVGAGATLDASREKTAEVVGPPGTSVPETLSLTARAKRALDRAARFSLQRRTPSVEPEHVLLGVLDVEGTAGQVLRGQGVDVPALHEAAEARAAASTASKSEAATASAPRKARASAKKAAPAPPAVSPRCPSCGAALGTALRYELLDGEGKGGRLSFVVTHCGACGSALGVMPAGE